MRCAHPEAKNIQKDFMPQWLSDNLRINRARRRDQRGTKS
jgi:hypothetical protein